jgi:enolase
VLPVPMMNILNGGAHADNNVDFQEFMVMPVGAATFAEALRMGRRGLPRAQEGVLNEKGLSTAVGDEGGFAPDLEQRGGARPALEAIEKAGYTPGDDIALALDVAATEFFATAPTRSRAGPTEAQPTRWSPTTPSWSTATRSSRSRTAGRGRLGRLEALTDELGDRVQLVGDDLFVTNPSGCSAASTSGVANAILVKVNQIGTLTETLDAVDLAHRNGYTRGDEPPLRRDRGHHDRRPRRRHQLRPDQDRAPARSDRVAKYNQLLRIEEELGEWFTDLWESVEVAGGRKPIGSLDDGPADLAAVAAQLGRAPGRSHGSAPLPVRQPGRGRPPSRGCPTARRSPRLLPDLPARASRSAPSRPPG